MGGFSFANSAAASLETRGGDGRAMGFFPNLFDFRFGGVAAREGKKRRGAVGKIPRPPLQKEEKPAVRAARQRKTIMIAMVGPFNKTKRRKLSTGRASDLPGDLMNGGSEEKKTGWNGEFRYIQPFFG
jgi:hypothetical protein